jgi:hypothetical protein
VTALPSFDNAIVKLAQSRVSLPSRLRPHPVVSAPAASLEEDLSGAIAVIGLGSTVLQEAAASGIPVVQLTHPDYLEYLDLADIPGVIRILHSDFSEDTLKRLPAPDAEEARRRFGSAHDEVTYQRLFL